MGDLFDALKSLFDRFTLPPDVSPEAIAGGTHGYTEEEIAAAPPVTLLEKEHE